MVATICPSCFKTRNVSRNIKPRNCYSCASKLAATPEKRAKHALIAKRTLNGFRIGHKPHDFDRDKHRVAVSKGALKRYSDPVNLLKASEQGKRLVLEGKCPFWKGGLTAKHLLIRQSTEYKLWRKAVFECDNYTCQECGVIGGRLNADHIKQFAYYPELRLEISNGRTLCEPCHRKTDTWGKKLSTQQAMQPMGGR